MDDDWDPFGGVSAGEFAEALNDSEEEKEEEEAPTPTAALPRKVVQAYTVPRVALDGVTREEFRKYFLEPRRPVILVDPSAACVPLHLNVDYFLENHGERQLPVDFGGPKQQLVLLKEFLQFSSPNLRQMYMRNLQMSHWFADEAKTLKLPEVFGPNLLRDETRTPYVCDDWRQWFELFICSHECAGFPFLHQDTCHVHAVGMQLQGRKRYIMFPPGDSRYLYPQPPGNTRSYIPDVDNVDMERFPLFEHAAATNVELRPGDILFCPADWWHTTKCTSEDDPSITINASFVDEGIYDAFCDAHCEFQAMKSLVSKGAAIMR